MPPKASAGLLQDADVRRWYENLARGSPASADINLRRLAAFCSATKSTPSGILSVGEKKLHEMLLDFVAIEEKRGVAGSYIGRTIIAVRSWLSHNGVRVNRPVKVRGVRESPTLRDERVPTQVELAKILLAGTPKIRVACALVAFSGVRPEVLGNYLGTDGLTLADLPELLVETAGARFSRTPAIVRVRPSLSKNSNGYLTFLGEEGCRYLTHYLEERIRSGEKLGPDSDLIHPERSSKRFIRTINIGDAIRTALRGAGFGWRPYVLRHYFDTQLLTAESRGLVAHDFRVHWMGHTGSIDARYTTNKRRLPGELIEEMRAAYGRCEPFLSTIPSRDSTPTQPEILRTILSVMGYDPEKLDQLQDSDLTVERVRQLIGGASSSEAAPERVVTLRELSRHLDEGWHFVSALGEGRAIVRFEREARASSIRSVASQLRGPATL